MENEAGTTSGHFLALGIPPSWIQPKTKHDRDLLAAARAVGAFRVLAHPFHPFTPWTDWNTSDFDGMEIWNEDAAWRQNNFFDLFDALLLYKENDQPPRPLPTEVFLRQPGLTGWGRWTLWVYTNPVYVTP